MTEESFIGSWRLVSFELRGEGDQAIYPYGEDPKGYIIYAEDGHMSVAFMPAGRPDFSSDDLAKGTVEEKAAAAGSYSSYCGRYTISKDTVTHHVEVSLFPNWVRVDQERRYAFDGDRLTLSTPPMQVGGQELVGHLIWERV